MIIRDKFYIDGAWVAPAGTGTLEVIDASTEEVMGSVPAGTEADADRAVAAAARAFETWGLTGAEERRALLVKLRDGLAKRVDELGEIMAHEVGMPLTMSKNIQAGLPLVSLENFIKILGDYRFEERIGNSLVVKEPVGVVAAITPWNSPLLLAAWKLAPALAAGCTVVLKPSEFTSASTLEFAELFDEAGFPPGVVNVVTGFGKDVGTPLVEHPLVRKVSFTGSDATGRMINEQAARQFKHASMELGGKSPNIVFADADLEQAVFGAVSGIFAATGQTCIAGSRLLVQDGIYDEVVERLVALAKTARMGDPMSMETQVGPVTTPPQYRKILDYIEVAKNDGAKLLLGGGPATRPECGKGWFVEPTIFGEVKNDMRIAQEEVFGPVLSIIRFSDEAEAVRIANDVRFGLAAAVWTRDIGRAIRMSEKLQAGTVWVNTYRAVSYMAPFGGYKDSGLGRENGQEAIREYLQNKTVWINSGAVAGNPFVMR